MADKAAASERLRAYVRDRVKPGAQHYERGNASRLAEYLRDCGFGEDSAWITAYVDPDAKPRRNASVDVALVICEFFGVTLEHFTDAGPTLSARGSNVAPSRKGDPSDVPASAQRAHLREIAALKTRITRLEIALHKVRDGARDLAKLATVPKQGRTSARRRA